MTLAPRSGKLVGSICLTGRMLCSYNTEAGFMEREIIWIIRVFSVFWGNLSFLTVIIVVVVLLLLLFLFLLLIPEKKKKMKKTITDVKNRKPLSCS